MQINCVDNTGFCARIRINKPSGIYYRDAAIMSGLGTTASGAGLMSSTPLTDPAHHVHTAAKVVDGLFALCGVGLAGVGTACTKFAHTLFKEGNKLSKINK